MVVFFFITIKKFKINQKNDELNNKIDKNIQCCEDLQEKQLLNEFNQKVIQQIISKIKLPGLKGTIKTGTSIKTGPKSVASVNDSSVQTTQSNSDIIRVI